MSCHGPCSYVCVFCHSCLAIHSLVKKKADIYAYHACVCLFEPHHEKTCFMPYANIKDAGQPAHPCSLISAFFVRCLDSIIPLVSISKISSLYLAYVAVQAGSQTPKRGFLVTRLILYVLLSVFFLFLLVSVGCGFSLWHWMFD